MKFASKFIVPALCALSLCAGATVVLAQDEIEESEEQGFFGGIVGWFSDLFSSDDDAAASGGMGWYAGVGATVTDYSANSLSNSVGGKAFGGVVFANGLGGELGYVDLGGSEIKGTRVDLETDGYRGLATVSSSDGAARLGLGFYSFDSSVGSAADSSSGAVFAVNFERPFSESLSLNFGVDLYLNGVAFGEKSDAIVFGAGISFGSQPAVAVPDAGGESVGVTETVDESAAAEEAEEP